MHQHVVFDILHEVDLLLLYTYYITALFLLARSVIMHIITL